ncbi:DUF3152 domain-containing protein [Actinoplanes sp. NPDC051861]|uniref:DUF3152 domain-containing protein n=1 Tax=Actinoplanes sp. NPDC051861 TaxID=3155170 RepID=UPI0034177882
MIPPDVSDLEPETPPRGDRWRQAWLVVLAATLVVFAVVAVGQGAGADSEPVGSPTLSEAPEPAVTTEPAPSTPRPAPTLESQPVATGIFPAKGLLRMPGAVPTRGSGTFEYASGRGPVAGKRGPLRRYRVAVERGSNEDARAFAEQVQSILSDGRSWTGNGRERLQMVGGSERSEFTVLLATRDTAGLMCGRGGTNIRINGVPFTSCRTSGKAIINLDRWRGSARPFVEARVDLATYRQYVINHEVGHELGHRHEGCPKAGGPAPVMVQQTITVRGCRPYAWPRLGNRDFSGPTL